MKPLARLTVITALVIAGVGRVTAQPPAPIDVTKLAERTDSFVVIVQSKEIGFQRTTIERREHGFRVVDDVEIGSIMTQHTEIELAPDGSLQATRQRGRVRGEDARIDISYAGGRATGSATIPSLTGSTTIAIDTAVAPGTVDDNLITALLPLLDWSDDASFTLPVFRSGKGYVDSITFAAKGIETVALAAGMFEAYRVEMSGGLPPVVMYVTTARPHRLVRIAPQGAPLEFVLATWLQSPRVVPVTSSLQLIIPN